MQNSIYEINPDRCTGCCACMNKCPQSAISMSEDDNGFIHPVIDKNKCTECGVCLSLCPVKSPQYVNNNDPECRAVIASDDIRISSASGGVFATFAEKIIERGGIVYGAAYNDDFLAEHISAETKEDLNKLKSSKYIQSNAGYVYTEVKKSLDEGMEVLFSGCPCQVAGLYSFLGDHNKDNLFTMDLICHGVPSNKVFRKYLSERFEKDNISSIDFRDKSHYGWSTEMNVYFKDGSVFRESHETDPFYQSFLSCLALRKSCATCPFSKLPRQGDLSIGDFWGISSFDKTLDDKKGTSVVLVNNEKGKTILEQCGDKLVKNITVPVSHAVRINKTIERPFRAHPSRERFFKDLDRYPLSYLTDRCLKYNYDIAIAGLWYGLNYGSILTYYALYTVVNEMGYDALMVNKPKNLWTDRYADKSTIANKFIYRHCNVSNIRQKTSDWKNLNFHANTFIVGSDVVWNYSICGIQSKQFFFLDFVNDSKKKIAMASSFGAGYDAPEETRVLDSFYAKKFDYIGVREKEGIDICKEKFGVKAEQVMDPVFLCDKTVYHKLADSSECNEKDKFVTSYILGPSLKKKEYLDKACQVLGCDIRCISNPNNPDAFKRITGMESLNKPSVEDWLYYIKNCDLFIGDSFHGLCFSLIFEKQFIIVVDRQISGLARFTTLLGMLELEERLFYTDQDDTQRFEEMISKKIDYKKVRSVLKRKSASSYKWLSDAISSEKKFKPKENDILISSLENDNVIISKPEYQELNRSVDEKNRQINRLSQLIMKSGVDLKSINDIYLYLEMLKINISKYIVFMSVKDTPGLSVTEEVVDSMKRLGVKKSIMNRHWNSFGCIIDGGKNIFEQLGPERVRKAVSLPGINGWLVSSNFKLDNVSKIILNKKEYSINKRGLNIVVWDKEKNTLVDSVCFDMHLKKYVCYRK